MLSMYTAQALQLLSFAPLATLEHVGFSHSILFFTLKQHSTADCTDCASKTERPSLSDSPHHTAETDAVKTKPSLHCQQRQRAHNIDS